MYLGRLTENASVEQASAGALHPYARLLLAAKPEPDPRVRADYVGIDGEVPSAVDPPSGCRFHTRCPIAIDECAAVKPELVDLGAGQLVACHRVGPQDVEKGSVDDVARQQERGLSV